MFYLTSKNANYCLPAELTLFNQENESPKIESEPEKAH